MLIGKGSGVVGDVRPGGGPRRGPLLAHTDGRQRRGGVNDGGSHHLATEAPDELGVLLREVVDSLRG